MSFSEAVKNGWDILLWREGSAKKASEQGDTGLGVLIVAIAGLLGGIGTFLQAKAYETFFGAMEGAETLGFLMPELAASGSGSLIAVTVVFAILGSFVATFFYWVAQLILGGRATFMQLYRPLAYVTVIAWAGIIVAIPIFGDFISFGLSIWQLVAAIFILKEVPNFSMGRAVGAVGMVIGFFLALMIIVFIMFFAVLLASWG